MWLKRMRKRGYWQACITSFKVAARRGLWYDVCMKLIPLLYKCGHGTNVVAGGALDATGTLEAEFDRTGQPIQQEGKCHRCAGPQVVSADVIEALRIAKYGV